MKPIQFYDLLLPAIGETPWSPNTYKTRFSLNIKGLSYETVWVTFEDVPNVIPKITFVLYKKKYWSQVYLLIVSKTGEVPTVPIIVDVEKDKVIQDSFKIAKYLETTYPETPSLFHGDEKLHQSLQETFEDCLAGPLFYLVLLKAIKFCGDEEAQAKLKKSREVKYGVTVEQLTGNPKEHIETINKKLKSANDILSDSLYLTGSKVGWADVVLASCLKMVDALDNELFETQILGTPDTNSLREWYKRMTQYA
ncbi:hypothetical protein CLU79DRAFT_842858 [Phycomyces nitens]|nr:hypothetical protein CLU79DRAFT_842858 [Phycomyces nitens]